MCLNEQSMWQQVSCLKNAAKQPACMLSGATDMHHEKKHPTLRFLSDVHLARSFSYLNALRRAGIVAPCAAEALSA